MVETLEINITEEDILNGQPFRERSCPLAKAIKRILSERYCFVNYDENGIGEVIMKTDKVCKYYYIDPATTEAIMLYDATNKMEPRVAVLIGDNNIVSDCI